MHHNIRRLHGRSCTDAACMCADSTLFSTTQRCACRIFCTPSQNEASLPCKGERSANACATPSHMGKPYGLALFRASKNNFASVATLGETGTCKNTTGQLVMALENFNVQLHAAGLLGSSASLLGICSCLRGKCCNGQGSCSPSITRSTVAMCSKAAK